MAKRIPCKTCEVGRLKKRRRYRMSGVVVAIGYIMLLPSLLGMTLATMGLVATGTATQEVAGSLQREIGNKLEAVGVDASIIDRVVEGGTVGSTEQAALSDSQRSAIREARLSLAAGNAGAGLGALVTGSAAVFVGVFSLVSGLLGWLLVMKKKVLQCNACGAVISAS